MLVEVFGVGTFLDITGVWFAEGREDEPSTELPRAVELVVAILAPSEDS